MKHETAERSTEQTKDTEYSNVIQSNTGQKVADGTIGNGE